jgi:alkanesulfonate monooxygenase SsuD/methylene tetrahydromethanopterin reductase-like flavin-dependent oxidoreductase (luciferase family)
MPVSFPSSLINGAVTATTIGQGSTVTVLSTDVPVRVYQQHTTPTSLAPGPVEITAGRGGTDPFPLYGYRPQGSGALYASKLEQVIEAVSIIGTYDPMEISAVTPAVRGYHTRPAGNERF